MVGAEERDLKYLFKLKQSANVKRLIEQVFRKEDWVEAGQQWQRREDVLRLSGWSQERRVVVLRRPLPSKPAAEAETVGQKKSPRQAAKQLTLDLPELTYQGMQYEYAVLVTSLQNEVRSIAQLHRDRGDAENNFDELKNQWGWAGFTTQDRKRCQIMGRIVALVYNWWTIFMRLGKPEKHAEAITSRPLALHGIARQTRHGNQTTVEITSRPAKATQIAEILTKVSGFLTMVMAVHAMNQGNRAAAARWILATMAAGATFVGLHLTEWMNPIHHEHITALGNEWGVPLFGATFFAITGLHMTHVVIGLIYLGIVCQAVMRGKFQAEDVEVAGLYWHFVDLVWMFVFPLVYLMSARV
jgi:heme/copper-type cytochrome/quinol oxidase subunit 3